jgi:hypothetical protein
VASICVHILGLFFYFFLQGQIDTVKVEGVGNVGEENWIEIKTEEDYIKLVSRVKCEQEVSVLCWCVLWWRFV